jgi:hypothetical protein
MPFVGYFPFAQVVPSFEHRVAERTSDDSIALPQVLDEVGDDLAVLLPIDLVITVEFAH